MKPIKGYEGHYSVSQEGVVYSDKNKRLLKHYNEEGRYSFVILWKNGKQQRKYVHRLVAQHYLENLDNLPQVGHKDDNKHNNHVDNLYWCNNRTNVIDAHKTGRMDTRKSLKTLKREEDSVIKSMYRDYLRGTSISRLSSKYNIPRTTISSIVNKRSRVKITSEVEKEEV